MKRNRLKIRIWLATAIGGASLALASSASAMLNAGVAAGPSVTSQVPVAANPGGFAWADAAIGAAVALAIVVAALAVAYIARNRSRFAPSH